MVTLEFLAKRAALVVEKRQSAISARLNVQLRGDVAIMSDQMS